MRYGVGVGLVWNEGWLVMAVLKSWMVGIVVGFLPAVGVMGQHFGSTTGTNLSVSSLTTGTVLDVGPSVSADGRYVTMGIRTSFSQLEGIDTFGTGTMGNGNGGSGGNGGGGNSMGMRYRPAVEGKVTFVEEDRDLLGSRVPEMVLKDVTLKGALGRIAAGSGRNIVYGNRAFEEGFKELGVDGGKTFTVNVEEGTVRQALLKVLEAGAGDVEVVVTAEENVVEVTTQAGADNAVVTRFYTVEELVRRLPMIVSAKTDLGGVGVRKLAREREGVKLTGLALSSVAFTATARSAVTVEKVEAKKVVPAKAGEMQSEAGKALMGQGEKKEGVAKLPAVKAGVKESAGARERAGQQGMERRVGQGYATDIVEMITATVRPEIWKRNGGKVGEIAVIRNRVRVKAPQSVQVILAGK